MNNQTRQAPKPKIVASRQSSDFAICSGATLLSGITTIQRGGRSAENQEDQSAATDPRSRLNAKQGSTIVLRYRGLPTEFEGRNVIFGEFAGPPTPLGLMKNCQVVIGDLTRDMKLDTSEVRIWALEKLPSLTIVGGSTLERRLILPAEARCSVTLNTAAGSTAAARRDADSPACPTDLQLSYWSSSGKSWAETSIARQPHKNSRRTSLIFQHSSYKLVSRGDKAEVLEGAASENGEDPGSEKKSAEAKSSKPKSNARQQTSMDHWETCLDFELDLSKLTRYMRQVSGDCESLRITARGTSPLRKTDLSQWVRQAYTKHHELLMLQDVGLTSILGKKGARLIAEGLMAGQVRKRASGRGGGSYILNQLSSTLGNVFASVLDSTLSEALQYAGREILVLDAADAQKTQALAVQTSMQFGYSHARKRKGQDEALIHDSTQLIDHLVTELQAVNLVSFKMISRLLLKSSNLRSIMKTLASKMDVFDKFITDLAKGLASFNHVMTKDVECRPKKRYAKFSEGYWCVILYAELMARDVAYRHCFTPDEIQILDADVAGMLLYALDGAGGNESLREADRESQRLQDMGTLCGSDLAASTSEESAPTDASNPTVPPAEKRQSSAGASNRVVWDDATRVENCIKLLQCKGEILDPVGTRKNSSEPPPNRKIYGYKTVVLKILCMSFIEALFSMEDGIAVQGLKESLNHLGKKGGKSEGSFWDPVVEATGVVATDITDELRKCCIKLSANPHKHCEEGSGLTVLVAFINSALVLRVLDTLEPLFSDFEPDTKRIRFKVMNKVLYGHQGDEQSSTTFALAASIMNIFSRGAEMITGKLVAGRPPSEGTLIRTRRQAASSKSQATEAAQNSQDATRISDLKQLRKVILAECLGRVSSQLQELTSADSAIGLGTLLVQSSGMFFGLLTQFATDAETTMTTREADGGNVMTFYRGAPRMVEDLATYDQQCALTCWLTKALHLPSNHAPGRVPSDFGVAEDQLCAALRTRSGAVVKAATEERRNLSSRFTRAVQELEVLQQLLESMDQFSLNFANLLALGREKTECESDNPSSVVLNPCMFCDGDPETQMQLKNEARECLTIARSMIALRIHPGYTIMVTNATKNQHSSITEFMGQGTGWSKGVGVFLYHLCGKSCTSYNPASDNVHSWFGTLAYILSDLVESAHYHTLKKKKSQNPEQERQQWIMQRTQTFESLCNKEVIPLLGDGFGTQALGDAPIGERSSQEGWSGRQHIVDLITSKTADVEYYAGRDQALSELISGAKDLDYRGFLRCLRVIQNATLDSLQAEYKSLVRGQQVSLPKVIRCAYTTFTNWHCRGGLITMAENGMLEQLFEPLPPASNDEDTKSGNDFFEVRLGERTNRTGTAADVLDVRLKAEEASIIRSHIFAFCFSNPAHDAIQWFGNKLRQMQEASQNNQQGTPPTEVTDSEFTTLCGHILMGISIQNLIPFAPLPSICELIVKNFFLATCDIQNFGTRLLLALVNSGNDTVMSAIASRDIMYHLLLASPMVVDGNDEDRKRWNVLYLAVDKHLSTQHLRDYDLEDLDRHCVEVQLRPLSLFQMSCRCRDVHTMLTELKNRRSEADKMRARAESDDDPLSRTGGGNSSGIEGAEGTPTNERTVVISNCVLCLQTLAKAHDHVVASAVSPSGDDDAGETSIPMHIGMAELVALKQGANSELSNKVYHELLTKVLGNLEETLANTLADIAEMRKLTAQALPTAEYHAAHLEHTCQMLIRINAMMMAFTCITDLQDQPITLADQKIVIGQLGDACTELVGLSNDLFAVSDRDGANTGIPLMSTLLDLVNNPPAEESIVANPNLRTPINIALVLKDTVNTLWRVARMAANRMLILNLDPPQRTKVMHTFVATFAQEHRDAQKDILGTIAQELLSRQAVGAEQLAAGRPRDASLSEARIRQEALRVKWQATVADWRHCMEMTQKQQKLALELLEFALIAFPTSASLMVYTLRPTIVWGRPPELVSYLAAAFTLVMGMMLAAAIAAFIKAHYQNRATRPLQTQASENAQTYAKETQQPTDESEGAAALLDTARTRVNPSVVGQGSVSGANLAAHGKRPAFNDSGKGNAGAAMSGGDNSEANNAGQSIALGRRSASNQALNASGGVSDVNCAAVGAATAYGDNHCKTGGANKDPDRVSQRRQSMHVTDQPPLQGQRGVQQGGLPKTVSCDDLLSQSRLQENKDSALCQRGGMNRHGNGSSSQCVAQSVNGGGNTTGGKNEATIASGIMADAANLPPNPQGSTVTDTKQAALLRADIRGEAAVRSQQATRPEQEAENADTTTPKAPKSGRWANLRHRGKNLLQKLTNVTAESVDESRAKE